MAEHVDILVVGGGINGTGIARDAAGRGLSVLLCERDDLASHTSSWSSKLVHGGLRYLEHGEFRLVRESLIEREVLMQSAPHLIRPLRFVLPHHEGLRPAWMLRLGLAIYDHLGGRRLLPATRMIDLRTSELGAPLKDEFARGLEYSDCFADDARLVIANAMDVAEKGGTVLTRTSMVHARRQDGAWCCTLRLPDGAKKEVEAGAVVNAAGPWVTTLFEGIEEVEPRKRIRLVKGSHIVVKQCFNHNRAYILQNHDKRIIFAIPYVGGNTLIGTTDIPYKGNPADAEISEEETDYLLDLANAYFKTPLRSQDILSTYSGVRPLYDDLSSKDVSTVTRDYAFDIDDGKGIAPLLSVYGGKLTTYRKLAQHALDKLRPFLPAMGRSWTAGSALPGGEIGFERFTEFQRTMRKRYSFLSDSTFDRMVSAYGCRLSQVLGEAENIEQLGDDLGCGMTEQELTYLIEHEFARQPEDILFRRTKLGLSDLDGRLRTELEERMTHVTP
jgi:glycerol-3-phosphate dehydrogenase